MDFARKQLLKYGWSDGKGLGKHENGISEALKPKLKRSVAGVGYDAAADFTEHWWSQLYDKAAGNVEVEETNGKTKKIKRKDGDEFEITNSTWKLNRKKKGKEDGEYSEHFVKKSILASGGSKVEKLKAESDSEEEVEKKDVFKMSDEELFAACGGRTAHKGARHGLKALGKLARIAQQEQALLLQPQFQGYSHAEKLKKAKEIVDDTNMNSDADEPLSKKKKKKRKRCTSLNSGICEDSAKDKNLAESQDISVPDDSMTQNESVASDENVEKNSKNRKSKDEEMVDLSDDTKKDKKKKKKRKDVDSMEVDEVINETTEPEKKRKKKKHKRTDE